MKKLLPYSRYLDNEGDWWITAGEKTRVAIVPGINSKSFLGIGPWRIDTLERLNSDEASFDMKKYMLEIDKAHVLKKVLKEQE